MKFSLQIDDKEVGRFDNRDTARETAAKHKGRAVILGPSDGGWDGKESRPRIYESRDAGSDSWTVLVP